MVTDGYTKEIEREIKRYALPNPYRHKRRWKLLFVSSDGQVMQSGNYRRVVTATLLLITLLTLAFASTTVLWIHTRSRLAEAIDRQHTLNATLAR